jgi:hypothetical protein
MTATINIPVLHHPSLLSDTLSTVPRTCGRLIRPEGRCACGYRLHPSSRSLRQHLMIIDVMQLMNCRLALIDSMIDSDDGFVEEVSHFLSHWRQKLISSSSSRRCGTGARSRTPSSRLRSSRTGSARTDVEDFSICIAPTNRPSQSANRPPSSS